MLLRTAVMSLILLQAVAYSFPATVEVDLVFPRNETYAPSAYLPMIFAFQNSALVPSLDPTFDITLWDLDNVNHTQHLVLDLENRNYSSSDPLFVYASIERLPASTYNFVWVFSHGNCSSSTGSTGRTFENRANGVQFTIQDGAQQPNFVAMDPSACNNFTHFAYNLTGTNTVAPSLYYGGSSCAILSDVQPVVSGNPCAVQINAQVASSISAVIYSPSATPTGKHSGVAGQSEELSVAVAMVGMLMALVAM